MSEPISTTTAVFYSVVGIVLLALVPSLETAVFAACLGYLTYGTWVFHADFTKENQSQDHGAMNATYLSLLTFALGGPWFLMAAAATVGAWVVEFKMDHPNRVLMGVCTGGAFTALYAAGEYGLLVVSVLSMGTGFALWHIREPVQVRSVTINHDMAHGLGWHFLTALGTGLMFWGLH